MKERQPKWLCQYMHVLLYSIIFVTSMNTIANTEQNIPVGDRQLTVIQLKQPQTVYMQCRICLQRETHSSMVENPLIIPCKCTGSVRFVHKSCLKQWIFKRITSRIHVGLPKCELCNHPYHIKKTCIPELGCKKRKLDETIMFIVSVTLTLAVSIFIPIAYYAPIQPQIVHSIVLGALSFVLALLTITTVILFKVSFIQVRKQGEIQPYREIPPLSHLIGQQNTQTPRFNEITLNKIQSSLTTRRSEQPTTAKLSRTQPE